MKKLNKILSLLLALAMLLGLAACSVEDVESAIQIASDVVDILEEIEAAEPESDAAEPAEAESDVEKAESAPPSEPEQSAEEPEAVTESIDHDGVYTSKEDVALYIFTYGYLPKNFITKNEARDGGWEGGSLEPFFPGMCIGGDYFGNREGILPDAKGRKWTECDINTLGAKSRGAERIVFSNDGLIYYTGDHYESFELLYGEP